MSSFPQNALHVTRRHFLHDCGVGLGKIALAGLLTDALSPAALAVDPLAPKRPHFPAKSPRGSRITRWPSSSRLPRRNS